MSDWIKMRSGLLTNPKVIRMSRLLATNRLFIAWWTRGTIAECQESVYEICDVTVVTRVTVGSLLSVWSAVNDCASGDGLVKGITLFEVDEMAGVPGFGDAMRAVGWVEEARNGLLFPNFEEHNTVGKDRSSKAKTGAERTKEWRQRRMSDGVTSDDESDVTGDGHGDVTVTSQRDHREEKKREEKKDKTSSDSKAKFTLPEWVPANAWADFEQMRVKLKKPMTDRARALAISKLDTIRGEGHDVAAVIEQTIEHSWDTFYPIKSGRNGRNGDLLDARFAN
jgi:hypothetical protein